MGKTRAHNWQMKDLNSVICQQKSVLWTAFCGQMKIHKGLSWSKLKFSIWRDFERVRESLMKKVTFEWDPVGG